MEMVRMVPPSTITITITMQGEDGQHYVVLEVIQSSSSPKKKFEHKALPTTVVVSLSVSSAPLPAASSDVEVLTSLSQCDWTWRTW